MSELSGRSSKFDIKQLDGMLLEPKVKEGTFWTPKKIIVHPFDYDDFCSELPFTHCKEIYQSSKTSRHTYRGFPIHMSYQNGRGTFAIEGDVRIARVPYFEEAESDLICRFRRLLEK